MVAVAACYQRSISGISTINNQLKMLAAMALETVMMTATGTMIKMKAVAAWRQLGGSAAAAAVLAWGRQHLRSSGGNGSSLVAAAAGWRQWGPWQLGGGNSMAAEAAAALQRWQWWQLGGGG